MSGVIQKVPHLSGARQYDKAWISLGYGADALNEVMFIMEKVFKKGVLSMAITKNIEVIGNFLFLMSLPDTVKVPGHPVQRIHLCTNSFIALYLHPVC